MAHATNVTFNKHYPASGPKGYHLLLGSDGGAYKVSGASRAPATGVPFDITYTENQYNGKTYRMIDAITPASAQSAQSGGGVAQPLSEKDKSIVAQVAIKAAFEFYAGSGHEDAACALAERILGLYARMIVNFPEFDPFADDITQEEAAAILNQ